MRRLLTLAAIAAMACTAKNAELDRKVDQVAAQLQATQRELGELRAAVAHLVAAAEAAEGKRDALAKLDALDAKVDSLLAKGAAAARPARVEPDRTKTYAVQVDGYPSDGPATAKITLVVMRDYACPYCEKNRETLTALRQKYRDDLRVVFRNMIVHPQIATAAAIAACAAARQHRFAAYDAALWDKGFLLHLFDQDVAVPDQPSVRCWLTPDGCPIALGFARDLKLDLRRFRADMKACEPEVQADMRELGKFGIAATPSFFVNGRFTSGAMPIEVFTTLIDEELAKADARIRAGANRASYYKDWVLAKGLTELER
jgi:protein-disulfide isomerase